MVESLRNGTFRHPLNEREENQAQERGTKMTQFTHGQAETFAANMMASFPALKIDRVLDVFSKDTGEYERSFFSAYLMNGTDILFHTYVSSEAEFNGMLTFCQYIASAIADNQQSKEEETTKSDHFCGQCGQVFHWSNEDISWLYEHPFLPCGHSWDVLDKSFA